jgi:predicted transcriptional regulator
MSETGETETTQPVAQPSSATSETVVLTVEEAADLLGITPQAVRKRIKAGPYRLAVMVAPGACS